MPHTKQATKKKVRVSEVEEAEPVKIKKAFDIDIAEPLVADKVEEVEVIEGAVVDPEDEESESVELDEEEINPFKDKWEE